MIKSEAQKKRDKKYNQSDKAKATKRRWYQNHKEEIKARSKLRKRVNREEYNTWARAHYQKNKEREKARSRAKYQKYKEKTKAQSRSHYRKEIRGKMLLAKYGITKPEYDQLLKEQGGVCAICRKSETVKQGGEVKSLSVDHNHQTGKIRGLLCSKCNMVLGKINDINILANAINYLEKNGEFASPGFAGFTEEME